MCAMWFRLNNRDVCDDSVPVRAYSDENTEDHWT